MYPHPPHVIEILTAAGRRRENLGLVLEKFVDWVENRQGNYTPNKRDYFTQASQLFKQAPAPETAQLAQAVIRRWETTLTRAPFPLRTLRAETLWYFLSGKGASDLVGDLLWLHQNFALPVIRASAIRGATHAYARDFLLPEGGISEAEIKMLFGKAPAEEEFGEGALRFYDAFPLTADCLRVTARTNQNDGYYSGKEELMCRNNVIPLFHLAVPPQTPFLFALGAADEQALELGEKLLRQSLRHNGTGAKTHVGYGYFKVLEGD